MESMPADTTQTVATLNLGMAVLVAFLSYPLLRGMVARNRLYGFRTRKSLASDEAWYAANELGGKCMIGGAIVILALNLVALAGALPLPAEVVGQLVLYSTPAVLTAAAVVALVLHRRG